MRALRYTKYGSPDVLHIEETEKPRPAQGEVLIRVCATSVNRTDNATIKAIPFFARIITGLIRPRWPIPGSEFSGVIEAVGSGVISRKIGESVYGFDYQGAQSHAEYVTIAEQNITTIPDNISFKQAAVCSEGAHYAHNFLNKVDIQAGQNILVNGATGAIGSAAVQLLTHFGVNVTAVCGDSSVELVKSLGARRIIDYTQLDFTKEEQQYHHIFDTVGKSSYFKCRRLILPGGSYISSDLGYLWQNLVLPPLTAALSPLLGNTKTVFPTPSNIPGSLTLIRQLMESGEFVPLIDREYAFDRIVDAYRYVEKGHKKGNVAITVTECDDI